MQNRSRSNVLLMEILIAILFFMLSATVLVQVFATARAQNERAHVETTALREAQNLADTLYVSQSAEETLAGMGFNNGHEVWLRQYDGFALQAVVTRKDYEQGMLEKAEISAFYEQDTRLFTLVSEKYCTSAEPELQEEGTFDE